MHRFRYHVYKYDPDTDDVLILTLYNYSLCSSLSTNRQTIVYDLARLPSHTYFSCVTPSQL